MKKILIYALSICLGIISLSCSDDDRDPVAELINTQELQEASTSNVIITKENADQDLITFSWSPADFGFPAAVTYTVQLDKVGNNFSSPIELGTTTSTSLTLSGTALNNFFTQLGAFPTLSAEYEVRVSSFANEQFGTNFSNVISIASTIFNPNEPSVPFMYIASEHPDWDWTRSFLAGSPESNGEFEGYAYFSSATNFKFSNGSDVTQVYGGSGGTLSQSGENIDIPASGYYKINADLNTSSFSVYGVEFGVIGDATADGWNSDQDLAYVSNLGVWRVEFLSLTSGNIKFRANDAWDLDFGDNEGDGTLDQGGANIFVPEEGSYTITLDFETNPGGPYTYTLVKGVATVSTPFLFLPGDYQGWDPATAPSIESPSRNGSYSGFVYMPNATTKFKFTDAPDWNNGIFGDAGDGTTGVLASPGNDITLNGESYYFFRANTNDLTWSATQTDWGLIGDAVPVTGWDSDVDMTYDPNTDTWSITLDLLPANIKFRANDAWDLNLGGTNGVLDFNGANIPIPEAGNYTIVLDLRSSAQFTYSIAKNN
ncbi:MAG: SusE domain-containing protein [Bacteroidetes bacterium]|nr:SusE domain-containing protein [Bacteroidota bacterium]